MRDITARQQRVLQVIADGLALRGVAPTRREIGLAVGVVSSCTTQRHVEALVRKGFLVREPYGYRALQLTDLGRSAVVAPADGVCPCCRRPYVEGEAR